MSAGGARPAQIKRQAMALLCFVTRAGTRRQIARILRPQGLDEVIRLRSGEEGLVGTIAGVQFDLRPDLSPLGKQG